MPWKENGPTLKRATVVSAAPAAQTETVVVRAKSGRASEPNQRPVPSHGLEGMFQRRWVPMFWRVSLPRGVHEGRRQAGDYWIVEDGERCSQSCLLVQGRASYSLSPFNGTAVCLSRATLNGSRKVLIIMAQAISKRSEVWQATLASLDSLTPLHGQEHGASVVCPGTGLQDLKFCL